MSKEKITFSYEVTVKLDFTEYIRGRITKAILREFPDIKVVGGLDKGGGM